MVPTDAKATVETLSQTISFAFLSLIRYAHFVSRYSISGLVRPLSQVLIERNVFGPRIWQPDRSIAN
jgi:hypothetical protein